MQEIEKEEAWGCTIVMIVIILCFTAYEIARMFKPGVP